MLTCLTSCGSVTLGTKGNSVSISDCTQLWGTLTKEQLESPTYLLSGCDILTRATAMDIKNNNDKLRD